MGKKIFAALFVALSIVACNKEKFGMGDSVYVTSLPAGNCTVYDSSSLAFSYKIDGLSSQQSLDFFVGNSFFNQNWVEAPSSTIARDGLGPLYNAKSCAGCHFRDGRGMPTLNDGLLIRLGIFDAYGNHVPEPIYGGQFQDKAISTAQPEGNVTIVYTEVMGTYPDGTTYSLRVPTYSLGNLNYGAIDPGVMTSPRVGPQMIGLGLLERVPEYMILLNADENDSDGDGISGRPNYVFDPVAGKELIGRFGWKANTASIAAQVAGAFNGDLGIKTHIFPNENQTAAQSVLNGLPDGGVIEISEADFNKVVLYSSALGVPNRRYLNSPAVQKGEKLFSEIGCAKCHNISFKTGNDGDISGLKNVHIRPYTDLLLHDMGSGLADNRPDGLASGTEWKTPPLWGIGLIETVNGHTYLLHDGRARNLEEAILWHGGEAEVIKERFKALTAEERSWVLAFLRSL